MRKYSSFVAILLSMSFASNAKISKSLKKIKEGEEIDDATLAAQTKTTKAYKENYILSSEVDKILLESATENQPLKDPGVAKTSKEGEPRW